jgi:beta-N-acetylhexosaminidase
MGTGAVLLVAAFVLLSSCSPFSSARRLSALSLDEKAAQVLLIGVEGRGTPSADSLALLKRLPVGGVLLFGYNLPPEPVDTASFTAALQDAVASGWASRRSNSGDSRSESQGESLRDSPIPLIIGIDHEGGSVFRFKGEGITRLPSPRDVGAKGERYAALLGRAAGSELRALGITMNFAPVVELLTDENEAFLGSRSYSRSGKVADAAAGAFIDGLQAEGVAAVAKHFPGNAASDPHKVLPELDLSKAVYARDNSPRFASAIRHKVAAVMLSHVLFPAIDPEKPASLSPAVVVGELRLRLGFRGLAITDDLCMRAISNTLSPESAAVEALAAGDDLLMLADMGAATRVRDAIVLAVKNGKLSERRLDEAAGRVLALKARFKMEKELDRDARAKAQSAFPGIVARNATSLKSMAAIVDDQ